jgi:hypothetical protein
MTRTTGLGAGIGVALLLAATLHTRPAAAADEPLTCGAVITHNATLTADIGPCPDAGIVVEGDGVILNLAGFALRGKPIGGIDDPDFLSDGVGVRVRNSTGVTVKTAASPTSRSAWS